MRREPRWAAAAAEFAGLLAARRPARPDTAAAAVLWLACACVAAAAGAAPGSFEAAVVTVPEYDEFREFCAQWVGASG